MTHPELHLFHIGQWLARILTNGKFSKGGLVNQSSICGTEREYQMSVCQMPTV